MKFLERIASRFGQAAGTTATEAAKTEVTKTAIGLGPVLLGVGTLLVGIAAFRSSSHVAVSPKLSQTRIVTNNWFLTDGQSEILKQAMKEAMK